MIDKGKNSYDFLYPIDDRNWDIEIAQDARDYDVNILYATGVTANDLVVNIDFNNSLSFSGGSNVISLTSWTGSTTSGFTLFDIGLTGIDNGRVTSITGSSLNFISGNSKLELWRVTGTTGITSYYNNYSSNTYTYPLSAITTANTSGYSWSGIGQYMEFGGGFYQGFHKLYEYPYEILPTRTKKGWTFETWLKFRNYDPFTAQTANSTTLNQAFTGNSGFFLYMGSRAENKFWNIFSGETGLTTSNSAVTFSKIVSAVTNNAAINGIGFRIKPDRTIGWKRITYTANTSGVTQQAFVSEGYSNYPIFTGTTTLTGSPWQLVTITYSRYSTLENCCDISGCTLTPPPMSAQCDGSISSSQKGDLTFYINGRPIYKVENFEEPIIEELETFKEFQQGVPFNISLGGGSQGLLETRTFGGADLLDTGLTISNNFAGTFNGGISRFRMYLRPLSVPEIINNFNFEKSTFGRTENFGGRVVVINTPFVI